MQTLVFDPGGSKVCLRACSFLGTWCALLCGEVLVWAPAGGDLGHFWQTEKSENLLQERTSDPYVLQSIDVSLRSQADTWSRQISDGTRL